MGKERVEIIEQMSVSVGDASRAENEDSLLVLFGDAVAGGGFRRRRFREGFVDGGHYCKIAFMCKL